MSHESCDNSLGRARGHASGSGVNSFAPGCRAPRLSLPLVHPIIVIIVVIVVVVSGRRNCNFTAEQPSSERWWTSKQPPVTLPNGFAACHCYRCCCCCWVARLLLVTLLRYHQESSGGQFADLHRHSCTGTAAAPTPAPPRLPNPLATVPLDCSTPSSQHGGSGSAAEWCTAGQDGGRGR